MRKCGLFIFKDAPYISASPDAHTKCKCCGDSIVEIKCPYVLRDSQGGIDNDWHKTDFLHKEDELIRLKESHKYYTQVQSQMAVTNTKACFFVVWCPNGKPHIEKIQFNTKHWDATLQNLTTFYKSHVLTYVLGVSQLIFCPAWLEFG